MDAPKLIFTGDINDHIRIMSRVYRRHTPTIIIIAINPSALSGSFVKSTKLIVSVGDIAPPVNQSPCVCASVCVYYVYLPCLPPCHRN